MTSRKPLRAWPGLALALVLLAGPAQAQLQTGDLFGTVTDNDGGRLPGVTVQLTGIGAPRIQITNAEGQYRFLGLAPGGYQLAFTLEGFSTVEYPTVAISVGNTTTIDGTLTPALSETITVTAETPLLDGRKQNRGTNISAIELDKIPTARDPWSLLSQAPGVVVDRINVGGNESGQQSLFMGTGSVSKDNTFAVDGVILTDMAAIGGSLTYYDFGAFEEVQFTVSSTDVTVATSGVTINQVTKRGTNDWRAAGRYLRTDGDLQSDPAQVDSGNGDLTAGNQIEAVEELGADFGGPLWEDKLWIWASYGESDIQNIVIGGQLDRTELEDFNSKLNFQASPSNSGVLHYWTNDKIKTGRGAGPTRTPESTHNQITPADIWKVEDTHLFGQNFFVTGLYSTNDGVFNAAPQGGRDADVFIDEDGTVNGSYWDFAQNAVIDQARVDASYFFNTGDTSHELKFGAGFRSQENDSGTVWPRGRVVQACESFGCNAAGNNEVVQFWRNKSVAIESTYDSAWIQDTITKGPLTVNVGLRYDGQSAENLSSSDPGNPDVGDLLPPLTFEGNDGGGFEWDTIVPRVGVTYALGEQRRTLLRGSFSRYAEQLGQGYAQRVNPLGYSYAAFYFTDTNANLVLDDDERGSLSYFYYYNFDPDNPLALSTSNINDPNLDPTLTDELTLGLEHALRPELLIGATVTLRNIHGIPDLRRLVRDGDVVRDATREDWELAGTQTAPLPGGGSATVPFYSLRDDLSFTGGTRLTNGDREQDYLGISLSATKRLANRWSLRGHATWHDWEWDVPDSFRQFDDPTDTVLDGLGFADGDDTVGERSAGSGKTDIWTGSRWSFNINGLYQVAPEKPWGFNVGASLTGREGFVSPPYVPINSPGRRLQLDEDFDRYRNDDIYMVDARIDKDFDFGDFGFTLSLDGFNLLNEDYVLQVERNAGLDTFDSVREQLSPRVFRLGVSVHWN